MAAPAGAPGGGGAGGRGRRVLLGAEQPLPATAAGHTLAHEPVLDLVTRALDLQGELEIAMARLDESEEQGRPTRIAKVEVRTAERKLQVVPG